MSALPCHKSGLVREEDKLPLLRLADQLADLITTPGIKMPTAAYSTDLKRLTIFSYKARNEAAMALVLCTGLDQSLLDTRALLLKTAGHEVHQARTQNEVLSKCTEYQFDVAVIGQSLSNRMKVVVASLVKEHCPEIKVLELYHPHEGRAVSNADAWLEVPADIPRELAEKVREFATHE